MKGFWPVLKVTFLDNFGLSVLRERYIRQRQRLWGLLLAVVGVGTAVVSLEAGLVFMAEGIIKATLPYGQPGLAFVMAFLIVQILTLFMGLAMVMSIFYFADDLPRLVPLPVGPAAIISAKYLVVLAGEYVTALMVVAPVAFAYVRLVPTDWSYWAGLVAAFVLAPVLPLALASILGLMLMRLINRRHRDLLMVVISIGLVVIIMAFQFSLTTVAEKEGPEALVRLMTEKMGLMKAAAGYFPPSLWAAQTVVSAGTPDGWGGFLLLAVVSLVSLTVMRYFGDRVFLKGLIGGEEVAAKRRLVGAAELAAQAKAGSVLSALFWREWRLFMRVPIFVMNGFMASIIAPVAAVFPIIAEKGGLGPALDFLRSTPSSVEIVTLATAAVVAFLGSLNTTGSTSLSREGKNFWISKVIPVRPVEQVQAKLLFAFVSTLVSAAPVVVVFAVALKAPLLNTVMVAVLGVLASLVGLIAGLIFDMTRPYFKWTNPQQAVKNNLNAVFPMFVDAAVLGGLAFLSVNMVQAQLAPAAVYGTLAAVLIVLNLAAFQVALAQAEMRYNRLDA